MKLRFGVLAISILFYACSSEETVNPDTWLAAAGPDTITVAEAAEMWSNLPASTRAAFEESENPSRDFVEILAGKMSIDRLVDTSGILDDPAVVRNTEIWTRVESATMARKLITAREAEAVTREDINFYRRNRGIALELGGDVPSLPVPFILTELPREMALALEGASPGDSVAIQGLGSVRVNSVSIPENPGSDQPDSAVVEVLAMGRERYLYLAAYASLVSDSGFFAAESFSNTDQLPEDSPMLSCGSWSWTRKALEEEASFLSTRFPALELSDQWRNMFIENLLMQSHLQEVLQDEFPETADSIAAEAEGYRRSIAADSVLAELMEESITVTRRDLEEEYALMENPVIIPEKRVFQSVSTTADHLPSLEEAVAEGSLPGEFAPLGSIPSSEENDGLSRPLIRSELPHGVPGTLFEIFPDDTTAWVGPYEVEPGIYAAFRLSEVVPAREATVDELTTSLTDSARRRLQNLAVEALLLQLREEYGVTLNSGAMGRLPGNPGLWPSSGT